MRFLRPALLPLHFFLTAASSALAQHPPAPSPTPGIPVPDQDREELLKAAAQLQNRLHALQKPGALPDALRARTVDVEIFPKAVEYALSLDEIYDLKQLDAARQLLAEGESRLRALQTGKTPWTTATGLVVRGYRSKIDHSVQPYGLVIPEDRPTSGGRLDIWLHGRSDSLTELAFLNSRMKSVGDFAPAGTIVLHPYGRFCNAYKFAGEMDVLEAMEDVIAQYNVSRDHIALRGFSMGGAGSWHLGAHYPGLWAVLAPGAGFAETAKYAKVFAPGNTPPPWWEQILWHLYDVPDYAANLTNCPVIAYSGEIDPQKMAADTVIAAVAAHGVSIPHLIGPNTGHRYHPEVKAKLAQKVDEAAQRGRPTERERVRLETYTLRYNALDWVQMDALVQHWERAFVDASHTTPGTLHLQVSGVTALTLTPPKRWKTSNTWKIQINDTFLETDANVEAVHLALENNVWKALKSPPPADTERRKRHGLQGPIDDAFMESFVFVRPTGKSTHPKVAAWASSELNDAIRKWKINFRGEVRVMDDTEVTPELMRSANLVLWGDPTSNCVLAQVLHSLPLTWTDARLEMAGQSYDASKTVPVLVYPNPLAPERYVVLNSSYTFRNGSNETNALQTPKLPDWAVVDLDTPPDHRKPGFLQDAGFFDEQWRFPQSHHKTSKTP